MRHGIILADLHCGHRYGLCPPQWQLGDTEDHEYQKSQIWESKTWDWYTKVIAEIGRVDHCIINGDAIDGSGGSSGGTELITSDRHHQVKIAQDCLSIIQAEKWTFVRGTPYHTGDIEDFEDILAEGFGTHAQDHAWLEYSGCVVDIKHHIGSTSVPRNVPPSLSRESVWNLLWAEHKLQPKSNVFIRSHLHKYYFTGDDSFTAMITPALQGWTKYGGRRMSKTISYGLIEFWINDQGSFAWKAHILNPIFAAAKAEQM
jgi:hypothetical protein